VLFDPDTNAVAELYNAVVEPRTRAHPILMTPPGGDIDTIPFNPITGIVQKAVYAVKSDESVNTPVI